MLGLELVVEALGNPVAVEGAAQSGDDVGEGDGLFCFQRPDDLRELLTQRFAALPLVPGMGAGTGGLARRAQHPQPGEHGFVRIGKDQQMFMGELAGFVLDLEQHGAGRNLAAGVWRAAQHGHAALVGDGCEREGRATRMDSLSLQRGLVPTEFVEQLRQLELAQQLLKAGGVDIHVKLASSARLTSASSYEI